MIKCKKCGEDCSEYGSFCMNCGMELPEEFETRCPECDRLVFDNYKFCIGCGIKIDKKKLKKVLINK